MELRGKHVAVIGTGAIGIEAIRLFKVRWSALQFERCLCCFVFI
jgi:phosphoglycerate dehydrogenase-like enzyme